MLKVYQFIASNRDLKETPLALGVADTPVCSSNLVSFKNFEVSRFFSKINLLSAGG